MLFSLAKLRRLYDVTNVLATVGLVKREVENNAMEKIDEESSVSNAPGSPTDSQKSKSDGESKGDSKIGEAASSEVKSEVKPSTSGGNAEQKLRGPVFRYTGPPIEQLPPVSAARLSEVPTVTQTNRQGSHVKGNRGTMLVRNGSATLCLPNGGGSQSPSVVLLPGNTKPLRIVPAPSHQSAQSSTDDNIHRLMGPLGLSRSRTFSPATTVNSGVMPSTPLLAPPRLASFNQTQSADASRVRPNSLLGKLLGSQPSAAVTNTSKGYTILWKTNSNLISFFLRYYSYDGNTL